MCGQVRAGSSGPPLSPSCLWFSPSWLITQQGDVPFAATGSVQDLRCDAQIGTGAADVSVELACLGIERQVEHGFLLQLQVEAGAEVHVQADRCTHT